MANKSQSDVKVMLRERNLAARVRKELDFLSEVDELGDTLYHPTIIRLAVARYELLWLPLWNHTTSHALHQLNPPLDIAFVWHTHCLCPVRCEAYVYSMLCSRLICVLLFIETYLSGANEVQAILQTICAWRVLAEVNLCCYSRKHPPSNQRFTFDGRLAESCYEVHASAVTAAVSSRAFFLMLFEHVDIFVLRISSNISTKKDCYRLAHISRESYIDLFVCFCEKSRR
jgi:hypothetical protein